LLSLLFSAVVVAGTRQAMPSPRFLGVLLFALLLVAYVVVWYSIRKRTAESSFMATASFRGRIYLLCGGIAILLGAIAHRDETAFFTAGAVTCCFGCYFLLVARKLRRGATTEPNS
jgi:hypothetical protein